MSIERIYDFLKNYGLGILTIILVVGGLFILGVFKVPYPDFKESCKIICEEANKEYISWGIEGDCNVCYCRETIPIVCGD